MQSVTSRSYFKPQQFSKSTSNKLTFNQIDVDLLFYQKNKIPLPIII